LKVLAVLLIAIGVLIAGLSGLCTVGVALAGLVSLFGRYPSGVASTIMLALTIGSLFIAIGVGLALVGRRLWNGRPKRRELDLF